MKGAVVIGCSAGGLGAVEAVLSALPPSFPAPVIVVQHQPPGRLSQLAELLATKCLLPVKEADEKEPVQAGHVYTAPPDYHLLIERDRTFALTVDEEVNHARPSIEVTFGSAADVFGGRLMVVVLTGANADGSRALNNVEERGGQVVVQDPREAFVATMPEAAIAAARQPVILPLSRIGPYLVSHFRSEGIVS